MPEPTFKRFNDLFLKEQSQLPIRSEAVSLLTQDPPPVGNDHPFHMVKPVEHMVVPNFNKLYDTIGTPDTWTYSSDAYMAGQFTSVASTAVATDIVVTSNAPWHLKKWPGAVQMYLVIHFFSCAPETVPTTIGNISFLYVDHSGATIPLGVMRSDESYLNTNTYLIPSPITDDGKHKVGQVIATLAGSTPSTGVYDFQIGFSAAYLMPASKGYKIENYDRSTMALD